jgi:hypothetical protein
MYEENVHYSFIEIEDVDVSAIKLLCGKYTGVVYCYGAASVNEEGIAARLKFDYIIIEAGNYSAEQLTVDEEFHTMIGDILVEMIAIEGRNEQT